MTTEEEDTERAKSDDGSASAAGVDIDRREALRSIGALASAAPAVAILLAPSASRALGGGGSPCEGCGAAPGAPRNTGAPGGQGTGLLGRRES